MQGNPQQAISMTQCFGCWTQCGVWCGWTGRPTGYCVSPQPVSSAVSGAAPTLRCRCRDAGAAGRGERPRRSFHRLRAGRYAGGLQPAQVLER
ncbi:hypothetical protein M8494_04755 [Serratia ureilytica]